jgi:hypothetical protein
VCRRQPYSRFHTAGLAQLAFFPQLGAVTSTFEPLRLAGMEQRILASLTASEAAEAEWREAAE